LSDFLACNNYDVSNELARLKGIPALVVTGAADVMTPPKLANFLAENIAGAKLEFIDACGHMLQVEKAHEFNRIIDEFLANLPPVEEEETE
jgi:pimeloyl-ACP methyl ester carboxylesterase